jgi:hypothetical protein
MNEAGRDITIGGTPYRLVLNVNAYQEIVMKYGGIKELADAMDDKAQQLITYPWIIALLANQGTLLANEGKPRPVLLTPEAVGLRMTPHELIRQRDAVFEAIVAGMRGETSPDENKPVDEVLEEINAEKNGVSAAE